MNLAWLLRFISELFGTRKPNPVPSPSPSPSPPVTPSPSPVLSPTLQAVVNGINSLRTTPLVVNELLCRAAQKHSEWQAANRKMGHTGEGGSTVSDRVRAEGYVWRSLGENVAMGYRSANDVVNAWAASPGHRANMLGNFSDLGVGVEIAGNGAPYWTAVFGDRRTGVQQTIAVPMECGASSCFISTNAS